MTQRIQPNRATTRDRPYGVVVTRTVDELVRERDRAPVQYSSDLVQVFQSQVREWYRGLDFGIDYSMDWTNTLTTYDFHYAFSDASHALLFKLTWGGK